MIDRRADGQTDRQVQLCLRSVAGDGSPCFGLPLQRAKGRPMAQLPDNGSLQRLSAPPGRIPARSSLTSWEVSEDSSGPPTVRPETKLRSQEQEQDYEDYEYAGEEELDVPTLTRRLSSLALPLCDGMTGRLRPVQVGSEDGEVKAIELGQGLN